MLKEHPCELFFLTPEGGKRLIARAIAAQRHIQQALHERTVVIVAGTTNGYVAEELLRPLGQGEGFRRRGFHRGIGLVPGRDLPQDSEFAFAGDVIIRRGEVILGKTIFDVVDTLQTGDIIFKGANAIDAQRTQAGVLIGHPQFGTLGATLAAAAGRRAQLIIPVGLEKRIDTPLGTLMARLNAPTTTGPRMALMSGTIVTELEAIAWLTGAQATLAAAGGAYGAQGSIYLAVSGNEPQLAAARELLHTVQREPIDTV